MNRQTKPRPSVAKKDTAITPESAEDMMQYALFSRDARMAVLVMIKNTMKRLQLASHALPAGFLDSLQQFYREHSRLIGVYPDTEFWTELRDIVELSSWQARCDSEHSLRLIAKFGNAISISLLIAMEEMDSWASDRHWEPKRAVPPVSRTERYYCECCAGLIQDTVKIAEKQFVLPK